jgi:hypothetical protein
LFLPLAILLLPWRSTAEETPSPAPTPRATLSFDNSVQTGIEYDSNIFKSFGGSEGGFLLRGLFKNHGTYSPSRAVKLGWDYQGGGKVYFDQTEQSALIQFLEVPVSWQPHPRFEIRFHPDFKYQNERNSVDTGLIDINEDYYSTTSRLDLRFFLPSSVLLEPSGEFTYFHFEPTENFGFFRESGGLTLQKTVGSLFGFGAQYTYGRQQFDAGDREDREHQISAFFQYLRVPFLSARYTYERTGSSQPQFSFHNHRVTLLLSVPILHRSGSDLPEEVPGMSPALFALHVLGTLQLKRFPSVFDYTSEGQRYLLTGAEDENFNSVVVKLSYHPFPRWAFETKYTRYSNEFSSQQSSFSRSLFYGGARFGF